MNILTLIPVSSSAPSILTGTVIKMDERAMLSFILDSYDQSYMPDGPVFAPD